MNFIVLHHRAQGMCLTIRAAARAQELVELAKHGDTLHVVGEEKVGSPEVLINEVQEQLRQGKYKEVQ